MKISVIPDLHGELAALKALLKAIGPSSKNSLIIQLGDFIDRGPDSRGCVELLLKLQMKDPERFIVLKGNHEDMLEKAPDSHEAQAMWMLNGGGATLKSYGDDFEALCRDGAKQAAWMASRPLTYECMQILFCHAGLSLKNQQAKDPRGLLWDRPPLAKGGYRAVVCGHTPTQSGRIEHQDGVFHCDLGLGRKNVQALEYLELELSETELEWKIKPA
jgi:serine/threonine protein phosphatase 1